jgi:Zn-dependent peptidase ImmA (M78 family)
MYNVLYNKARKHATEARQKFGVSHLEPLSVDKVYKIAKISCIRKPLDSDISGIFMRSKHTKVVVINTNKTLGHQNFTSAHELYHSEYDENLEARVCKAGIFDSNNKSEMMADLFATHFLMPEEGIKFYLSNRKDDFNDIDLSDVIYLEQLYGVSHFAMLVRLKQLQIIDEKTKEHFLPRIRMNARKYGYDEALYIPTKEDVIVSNYVEQAQKALDNDLITFSRYEELLRDANLLEYEWTLEEGVEDYVD